MIVSKLLEQDDPEFNALIHTLRTQCSEFLSNPSPLYRGTDIRTDRMFVLQPIRTDRKSLSGRNAGTAFFNLMFEEEYGVPNIRNQSAFCANVRSVARAYGDVWFAFPMNGSTIAYDPEHDDSYVTIRSIVPLITEKFSRMRGIPAQDRDHIIKSIQEVESHPMAPTGWFDNMINNVSPAVHDAFIDAYDSVKHLIMSKYEVCSPKNLPHASTGIEFMVTGVSNIILVSPESLYSRPGFDNSVEMLETWYQLIKQVRT